MIKLKDLLEENWWDDLSDKAQAAYIKKHGSAPNVADDDEDEKDVEEARLKKIPRV